MRQNFDLLRELREQDPERDWKFGALSQPGIVSIPPDERETFLPLGETQFDQFTDFSDCASRSPVNHLEALFNYHYAHNMLPSNKKWMQDSGYIQSGKITFSDRYIAVTSGTTKEGNSLKAPVQAIHSQGLIPKSLLPKTDTLTWDEYYAPIPQNLLDLGQEFLRRFTINYEQVLTIHFGDALKDDMIGTAGAAWPIPVNGVYPRNNAPFNHAFLIYNLPKYQIFDNYVDNYSGIPNDYTKTLDPEYLFFDYGYRVYVSAENNVEKATVTSQVYWALFQNGLTSYFSRFLALFNPKVGSVQPAFTLRDILLALYKALTGREYAPETPNLPPVEVLPPPMPKSLLVEFCTALRDFEGNPGDLNYKNNNPGNCRCSQVGYLPKYGKVKCVKNFAVFETYELGWLYLTNLVADRVRNHREWDFYRFFAVWAPSSDNNNPKHYAETIAKRLGVPPTTKLSTIL